MSIAFRADLKGVPCEPLLLNCVSHILIHGVQKFDIAIGEGHAFGSLEVVYDVEVNIAMALDTPSRALSGKPGVFRIKATIFMTHVFKALSRLRRETRR